MPSAIVGPIGARPANGAHAAACTPTSESSGRSARKRDRDARGEAAAADRDHDRARARRKLLRELEAERPLAGDHAGVVEGVDERRSGRLDVKAGGGDGVVEALARRARRSAP